MQRANWWYMAARPIGVGTNGMAPYPYPVGGTVQYVNMPVEIDEKTLTPVSYTHLDVYKRQGRYCVDSGCLQKRNCNHEAGR